MQIRNRTHYAPKTNFKSLRKEGLTFVEFEKYNQHSHITSRLKEVISNPQNYISEGKSNAVYKLPDTNKFLLKIYKGLTPENISSFQDKLSKTPDIFTKINIGQPIARMGRYILFIIKQDGEQHSVSYTNKNKLTKKDLKKYLSDIKKIAKIQQKAYINFTDEIKELTNKNYYIDYFNSNNLLTTKSEINIVDTVKITQLKQRALMFPSKESIMKILLDEKILPKAFQAISKKEKLALCENIRKIEEKIEIAMVSSKLPKNELRTKISNFILDALHNKNNHLFTKTLKKCLLFK